MKPPEASTQNLFVAGLILAGTLLAVYLLQPPIVRHINLKALDAIRSSAATKSATGKVAIVDLDEESLARYGQWPWPRYRLARLLDEVARMGARSIALGMVLSEPDRTSPKVWQEAMGRELGFRFDIDHIPTSILDHDAKLAATLAAGPFALGFEFLFQEPQAEKQACSLHPLSVVRMQRGEPSRVDSQPFHAAGAVCNLKAFAAAVSYSGFLNATPDSDGILRRIPLLIRFQERLFPSLALASVMQANGLRQIELRGEDGEPVLLKVGEFQIPVDRRGNMLLDFGPGPHPVPRISAAEILDGRARPDRLAGKIILVGSTASGWEQFFQTPGHPVYVHVDVHAQAIETLLSDRHVFRSSQFAFWEAAFALLCAITVSLFVARTGIAVSTLASGVLVVGIWQGAMFALRTSGSLFSPLLPTVVVGVAAALLTLYKTWENQQRARDRADCTLALLKSSESNLNSIIQTIPDIIFRLDADGHITFISPAVSKYHNPPERLIGRPIFDLVAPQDRKKAAYRINERRTGERSTRALELRLLLAADGGEPQAAEGALRHFSISAEGIYQNDSPSARAFVGTQGIIRDITEQKELENQLVQAQKLEAVGSLAAGIAHDLNNILSGLVSYPDLLLLELPADSPLRKRVTAIQKSGEKAAAIVRDLLSLARRGVEINEVFNLNSVIVDHLEAAEFHRLRERHPRVRVETRLTDDLMGVRGSPMHLSKALMNIVGNAAEAMPAGGKIVIRTENKYLDLPHHGYEQIPEGEYVTLQVADEGVGIGSQEMQRIFEPFYTRKTMRASGTGLGMTVIWATVKDHHGYLDVSSREGEGTRIDIYLPADRKAVDPKARRVVLEDYLGSESILVVDDVPEQREIAVQMLTKLGYTVSSVPSGEAAVNFFKANPVELVVLDMIMPGGMDGLDTYRQILSIRSGQKAIIASGFSESERVAELKKLGAGEYIQKPYTLEKLGLAVRGELDRARTVPMTGP